MGTRPTRRTCVLISSAPEREHVTFKVLVCRFCRQAWKEIWPFLAASKLRLVEPAGEVGNTRFKELSNQKATLESDFLPMEMTSGCDGFFKSMAGAASEQTSTPREASAKAVV